MAVRRSLVVGLAAVLGVGAGGAAYAEIHSVQSRAYSGAKLVDVYMVTGPIGRGTTGAAAISSGLIKKTQMPEKFRPAGAVSDLAAIAGDVAGADVPSGQVLVGGLFVSPSATASTAAQAIPKGDVAITVSADQVHGVAGLIQPGDKVDVFVQMGNGQETLLLQSVSVMAVGQSVLAPPGAVTTAAASGGASPTAATSSTAPSTSSGGSGGSGLYTFAVTPDAAARVALAQSNGGGVTGALYLALVPPGGGSVPVPTVSSANLLAGNGTAG